MRVFNKKFSMLLITIFFGFLFFLLIWNFKNFDANPKKENDLCFDNENKVCIRIEIARTPEDKALGLMHRRNLSENEGMLFIYDEEGYHAFWMKNMNFPLDIIWLDEDKKIVYISEEVSPCKSDPCPLYSPPQNVKVKYVLEVNANFSKENNLSVGKKVAF